MKWDQGLLTLFLIGGVTALTAVACGPSMSTVPVLQAPRGVRQMNVCASLIGSRESKVVGMGAAVKDGAAPISSTTAICKQVYDQSGTKSYKWSTEDFGYKMGANDRNQMNIDLAIEVLILEKKTDEAQPIVKKISDLCRPQIEALWPKARLGSSLNVSVDSVVLDGAFQYRKKTKSSHLLVLSGNENSGYVIDHWSNRARFNNSVSTNPDYITCIAKNAKNPTAQYNCATEIYPKLDASNNPFCAEVAVMVGHYLGLSQGLDKDCGQVEAPAPRTKDAVAKVPTKSFMNSAANINETGADFFKSVAFTDADRRTVIDRGCKAPVNPAATPAPSPTPQPSATP